MTTSTLRERCTAATTADELRRTVAALDPYTLTATDVAVINRTVRRLALAPTLRVAFGGTHMLEPLPAYVGAHAIGLGIFVDSHMLPYGQYVQPLLAPESELKAFQPDILFLSLAMRQVAPRIHNEFALLSFAERAAERDRIISHVTDVVEAASEQLGATILVSNFPRPAWPSLGVADSKSELGEMEFYSTLNLELIKRFRGSDRIHILDLDRLVGGARPDASDRMYFIAKSLWSDSQANFIAQELLRYAIAATGQTRKCLVVDLDNTLWGGVAGEDGPAGVLVGPDSPTAEAFESLQHAVRSLRGRGAILAICSKNNSADVKAVFSARESMPLSLDDFSVCEISWNDKGRGLLGVASALNIGVESLVFADDNPAERAIVRGVAPGVEVLEMPGDPADYAAFIRRLVWFEKLRINTDDLTRVEHYAIEQRREQLRAESNDLGRYLESLGTEIRVRDARAGDLARIHELFNKTNQFNLTTRRYSLGEVERFYMQSGCILGVVTAGDHFGQMGTIAVYLVDLQGPGARLDSFLMSCRALGRGIETAVMNCLKRRLAELQDCEYLDAEFLPTEKNAPARDYLESQGFAPLGEVEDGARRFRLHKPGFVEIPCPHLKVVHDISQETETT
jgi:FkbH-like protein